MKKVIKSIACTALCMFLMSSAFAENVFNLQVGYDKKEI